MRPLSAASNGIVPDPLKGSRTVSPMLEKLFIHEEQELFKGIFLKIYDGHTTGQMIPHVDYNGRTVVFMADFIPSVKHIPLPFIASYDVQPLVSIKEKTEFFKKAIADNYALFFEHDPFNECCGLQETDKGVRVKEVFELSQLG